MGYCKHICTDNINTWERVLPFWGWTAYTPVIPKLYWDCISAEQAVKNLWKSFDKLCHYSTYVAQAVNEIDFVDPAELDNFQNTVNRTLQEMQDEILQIMGGASLSWNVRYGKEDTSIESMRDMFRYVTVHAYRIQDINNLNLTVAMVRDSGLNCEGWGACNSYYIDNHMTDALTQYLI